MKSSKRLKHLSQRIIQSFESKYRGDPLNASITFFRMKSHFGAEKVSRVRGNKRRPDTNNPFPGKFHRKNRATD